MRKLTNEEFEYKLTKVLPQLHLDSSYTNARTKVTVTCNKCGTQFSAFPNNLLSGHGCPTCANQQRGNKLMGNHHRHNSVLRNNDTNYYDKLITTLDQLGFSYTTTTKGNDKFIISGNYVILIATTQQSNSYYLNHERGHYLQLFRQVYSDNYKFILLNERDMIEPNFTNFTKDFLCFKLAGTAEHVLYGRNVKCCLANTEKDKKVARDFISKYHSQGNTGARYYFKFTYQDELIGVMSFGVSTHPKYAKNKQLLELKRMVWLPNYQVRYGLSKGIKTLFKVLPQYDSILSYSQNNIGNGNAYQQAGFELLSETAPKLTFVNPRNANDTYSYQICSSWGYRSGVLAKHVGSKEHANSQECMYACTHLLPHRTDKGKGYLVTVDAGNRVWLYKK